MKFPELKIGTPIANRKLLSQIALDYDIEIARSGIEKTGKGTVRQDASKPNFLLIDLRRADMDAAARAFRVMKQCIHVRSGGGSSRLQGFEVVR
jgi:hypothetical protein